MVLAHGDTDGITAAAIVKSVFRGAKVYFTHPVGLLGDFREFARRADRVVIVDISLDERLLPEIVEEFRRFGGRILYIDHHPFPPGARALEEAGVEVVHEEGPCAAELAYRRLNPGWEMSRVALYGAIGDYALDTPWVREAMSKWDIKSLFLEAGVLVLGLEYFRKDYEFKRRVVEELSRDALPTSIPELVLAATVQARRLEEMRRRLPTLVRRLKAIAYVVNPPGSLGLAAFYARVMAGKPVGVAVEERNGTCVMSLRSSDPRVDLNSILRKLAPALGGHGGGHRLAAGARVPSSKLEEFLRKLDEEVSRLVGP